MSLRARQERKWRHAAGGPSGAAFRASGLVLAFSGLLLFASPLTAQRAARGGAFVQIPAVSQLDVQPSAGSVVTTSSGVEHSGVERLRVRANHGWRVVLAAPAGSAGAVWVRVSGAAEYRRLDPGAEMEVAAGERGETVVAVEYRLEGGSASEREVHPLIYTLASQ